MRNLKYISMLLIGFKLVEYIIWNVQGNFSFPIEISTITYFLFAIILLFDIKKGYQLASFFGIISGIGFFLYYSLFGFISSFEFDVTRQIIAVICHGILLMGGLYLFINNDFNEQKKFDLYIAMITILAHASIFYVDSIKNSTFIYYLVKPEFLEFFQNIWLNYLVKVVYYVVLFILYRKLITSFYQQNYKCRNQLNHGKTNSQTRYLHAFVSVLKTDL